MSVAGASVLTKEKQFLYDRLGQITSITSYCKYKKNCLKRRKGEMTGAQPVKGAVRLLRVVDGATRTAYGS